MQSVAIPVVTQVRVSDDYQPSNDQWLIGDSSILTHSMGLAPSVEDQWVQVIRLVQQIYSSNQGNMIRYQYNELLIITLLTVIILSQFWCIFWLCNYNNPHNMYKSIIPSIMFAMPITVSLA